MAKNQGKVGQGKSRVVASIPLACADESAAVEFMEDLRWGNQPFCPRCGNLDVYKMADAETGKRSRRYLWRCRDCKRQYTVRIGTVYEESRIPLKHWCYAFWRASTSKKGVSALEIRRQTGISYKSALFLLHRIRFAMANPNSDRLIGIVEADETYIGGKPRNRGIDNRRTGGFATKKTPVFAAIQRDGDVRARVIPKVNARNLRRAVSDLVDEKQSSLMTDDLAQYRTIGRKFAGGHQSVRHGMLEYARGNAHVNTCESFFALLKRGIHGIYHNVSKKHLHRYLSEFEFRFNGRKLEDGERTVAAIRGAEGKRLFYEAPPQPKAA